MGIKFIPILLASCEDKALEKLGEPIKAIHKSERRMMTMSTSITSNATEGQKTQYSRMMKDIVRHGTKLALKKVEADSDGWQRVLEHGDELRVAVAEVIVAKTRELSLSNQFADEEVESMFTYPDEYQLQPIEAQIKALLAISAFKDLDASWALENGQAWYDGLQLPEWVEGPLVYVWHERFGGYHALLELVLSAIAESLTFHNYRQGKLGEKYLRQSERSVNAELAIKANQPGDVIIVPNQAGIRFRGKSARRACVLYNTDEFGLGAVAESCRALSHPKRFVRWEQLHVDCGGDEYAPLADGDFCHAPYLVFCGGGVEFDTFRVGHADVHYGSSSALVPQQL